MAQLKELGLRGVVIGCFAFALVLQPSALAAQSAQFEDLVGRAVAEYGLGHWEEARSLFKRAHALNPNARTLRGLGMVEYELRHYASCTRLLNAALLDQRHALTPELRRETQQLLKNARAFVGRYRIELRPPSATLTIDGANTQPGTDGVVLLDVGEHRVLAVADGHADLSRRLDVAGGEDEPLVLELKRLPASVPPPAAVAAPVTAGPDTARTSPAGPDLTDPGPTDDDTGVLASPWFWIATGAVAVAGAAAVIALTSGGEDAPKAYGGNTGLVLQGP